MELKIAEKYDLRALAKAVVNTGANLAESRHEWIVLMRSMAGGGEALRESFHQLAARSTKYKARENEREFTKAIAVSSDESLRWFLKKAKDLGINLVDFRRLPSLKPKPTKMNYIPKEYVARCRSDSSAFVQSMVSAGILTAEQAHAAAELYQLGAMKDGSVIYWQIDDTGQVRDGKVMLYGPDCHRLKDKGAQWMGWLMRYRLKGADGRLILPPDWQATQCLFGLSLLTPNSSRVFIVEAEKTAVIMSQLKPSAVWLATGGESQLNVDKLSPLKGRKVTLFPDTDQEGKSFALWQHVANEARRQLGLDVTVSDFLEKLASPEQKVRKIDIADFVIEGSSASPTEVPPPPELPPPPPPSPELQQLMSDNPAMKDLVDAFGLVEIDAQ